MWGFSPGAPAGPSAEGGDGPKEDREWERRSGTAVEEDGVWEDEEPESAIWERGSDKEDEGYQKSSSQEFDLNLIDPRLR